MWEEMMISRRAVVAVGALAVAAHQTGTVEAAATTDLAPFGAGKLKALAERLSNTQRRRDFKSVPMILTDPDQWDRDALSEILSYSGGPKQVWDHVDIAGPWLNLMRNSLNAQIWSYKNPDFLCVSGTHGSAHLALYDQAMWDKYQLAGMAGDKFKTNTLIEQPKLASSDAADFENPEGVFSSTDNAIPTLMRRGVVFLACHNAIAELADRLIKKGVNPDKLSFESLTAELTNHLNPDTVLTPGVVATLPLLQEAGFHYAK
jgi:hypothetical protein